MRVATFTTLAASTRKARGVPALTCGHTITMKGCAPGRLARAAELVSKSRPPSTAGASLATCENPAAELSARRERDAIPRR